MFFHEVFSQPIDGLERVSFGCTFTSQAYEPSVLFPHRHLEYWSSEMFSTRFLLFGLFVFF